jgi:hypothetical protein
MTFPSFVPGEVLRSQDMNAVGLWLVKTQTVGTGVSSVTVNDAFTNDFDNFRIIYSDGTQSANNSLNIRLGASSASYSGGWSGAFYASGLANTGSNNNTSQLFIGGGDANGSAICCDVLIPNRTKYTNFVFNGVFVDSAISGAGRHAVAAAYTGFTILTGGGTMSGGTIRVYGYTK